MMQFDQLVLSGFKSFVDKTQLDIQTGLTGIVGPNGCGKSNLVEALRWAMGESSAKRMRGGDMDDVIFNGTAGRPARNFAEVILILNNGMHTAPAPYTPFDRIEISRKIEREQGSTYRVNGKVARARDVQLLLADTRAGANSPALVSQGKLTQIITAKPFDRRQILEESAGITGLHARRHEAELRLQAADNNLIRLQDSLGGLESQLASLKRQARQAEKYRVLTDEIKTLEKMVAALDFLKLARTKMTLMDDARMAESQVADYLLSVSQLEKTLADQSADLPALRTAAATSGARHQAMAIELRGIEAEEQKITDSISESRAALAQNASDEAHDTAMIEEGKSLLSALESEEMRLRDQESEQSGRLPALTAARDELEETLQALEQTLTTKNQELAETRAARGAIMAQLKQDEDRSQSAKARIEQARARLQNMNTAGDSDSSTDVSVQIAAMDSDMHAMQSKTSDLQQTVATLDTLVSDSRAALASARDELTRLQTERRTLEGFLASDTATLARPVFDDIAAQAGFEQAVAKALGDTLMASADEQAAMIWRRRAGILAPAFPEGVMPLDSKVSVPDVLRTAISFIGYVQTRAEGDVVSEFLKPGQIIVSLDGYLWRWDGFFMKPSAKDKQAILLEHKNRLADLTQKIPSLEFQVTNLEAKFKTAEANLSAARAAEVMHHQDLRTLQGHLNAARAAYHKHLEARQEQMAERTRLTELISILEQEQQARDVHMAETQDKLAGLPDPDQSGLTDIVVDLRAQTTQVQTNLRNAEMAVDRFAQEDARRRARLHGIADERISIQNRSIRAEEHMAEIGARAKAAQEKLDSLLTLPADLMSRRSDLMSRLSEMESDCARDADALQVAENDVAATVRALKEAEHALNTARENRAGSTARLSMLEDQTVAMTEEITQHFGTSPEELMAEAIVGDHTDADTLASVDDKRARKEKLIRDRDAIGPVNLRADVEAQEIESQVGKILTERDDLTAAIAELRDGIAKINLEAKTRLHEAFDNINGHFKNLFNRLFGGGNAYLQLIESDDPLAAGLEIYAQPPGKSLQSISLLSGGEQSLTAAALIFAMFLTNPSPICVLDEIDAPLDDANVDRICNLLRYITDTCGTRFLVVTHHRLTMARMDRLYGVTMSEKGVSQLVSVDLSNQMDMLEAA